MADFDKALKVILVHEGGSAYTDDPADPGGATKYGISLRFLKDHGIDLDGDGDIDAEDVRGLDPEKAAQLYRQFFWNLVHGDDFADQAVATKLFDMAVNMGPGRAIILIQKAVLVPADGVFGPKTFAAINGFAQPLLFANLESFLGDFYRGIVADRPKSAKFLEGWLVRAACTLSTPCKTCRARLKS
jgi:lysozyme family protein